MATLRSLSFRGKEVNGTGHTEHREQVDGEFVSRNVAVFDENGLAEVPDALAHNLVESFPFDIELVE